jgi:hypothetical protein
MATLDLIELLLLRPVGGPRLGVAVGCLMLMAAVQRIDGTPTARGSKRTVAEGGRGGARRDPRCVEHEWLSTGTRTSPMSVAWHRGPVIELQVDDLPFRTRPSHGGARC